MPASSQASHRPQPTAHTLLLQGSWILSTSTQRRLLCWHTRERNSRASTLPNPSVLFTRIRSFIQGCSTAHFKTGRPGSSPRYPFRLS